MNLSKFAYAYSRHGLIGFFNVMLGKIGIRYRLKTPLDKIIFYLGRNIEKLSKNRILDGIYKDTRLEINRSWNSYDVASKFLGLYEKEVQDEIFNIQKNKKTKKKNLINLGAGEGYHLIGSLKKKLFNYGVAYEMDNNAKNILNKNLIKNNLQNKVIIFDKVEGNFLEKSFPKTLKLRDCFFLIDIEGDEFKLLNRHNLNKLNKSVLIIELHDFYFSPNKFLNSLKKIYKVKVISTENRNLSKFKILENFPDVEKWLLVNEGRPKKMEWIICIPK
tara:strand:- start:1257 stop:2081 length:825 start_codon:yes stop_codon:yes gene_type:complete